MAKTTLTLTPQRGEEYVESSVEGFPPPSFPKFFIGNPRFCFFFDFLKPWTPDRSIQGQAKNGLKIAGVTAEGVIEPFRGDEKGVIEAFRNEG